MHPTDGGEHLPSTVKQWFGDPRGRWEGDTLVVESKNFQGEFFGRMDAPDRKAFYDSYANSTANYILAAIRIATPAQKAHAQKRMQGWIDDFNVLAREAK